MTIFSVAAPTQQQVGLEAAPDSATHEHRSVLLHT